ncbi:MAG: alcohol dehydrogenase catalytic domain-containing protein [Magnetococcales bacterium]|nr:alcohol dehydrogenase catalytic domain-containing protein [Magnetococcales bacterium]MBF0113413.1 alcohol dehydrogenase catalytic domain-containing protein [Magnetococcales bacterium]
MRALTWDGAVLRLREDLPVPQPAPHEALLRVRLAGVCATDLAILRGYKGFRGILGHEFVGEVVACADTSWLGARVVGEINCGCGDCPRCQKGGANHCAARRVLGIHDHDGLFAEFACVPLANLHRVPESMRDPEAVLIEPLAAALRCLEQLPLAAGQPVGIVGDGRLGILVAHVLACSGYAPTLIGHHPEHATAWPAGLSAHYRPEAVPHALRFDTIIECSGQASGLAWALANIEPMGRILLKSTFPGEIPLAPADWVVRELQIIGSRCGSFAKALPFMQAFPLPVERLITATYPLRAAVQALAHAGRSGSLKIFIQP